MRPLAVKVRHWSSDELFALVTWNVADPEMYPENTLESGIQMVTHTTTSNTTLMPELRSVKEHYYSASTYDSNPYTLMSSK